jgi:diguanylate cyclase (GGDEF)-like protein/PAS domain S-box-containing protein
MGHRLSLKWKATILLVLILTITYGLVSLISYRHFQQQFAQQQQQARNEQVRQLQAITQASADKLVQLAETIALLDLGSPQAMAHVEQITEHLRASWGRMQLVWELEMVQLYSASGTLLWDRGRSLSAPIAEWAREASREERPNVNFFCEPDCLQLISTPLILAEDRKAVLVIGRNLGDFLREYQTAVDADAGILSLRGKRASQVPRHLPDWDMAITALTNSPVAMPILETAAQRYRVADIVEQGGIGISVDGRSYDLQLIPVSGGNLSSAYFVVLKDHTEALSQITARTRDTLLTGVMGVTLATVLLGVLFWAQAARLRRITRSLPLLAEHRYRDAHSLLDIASRPIRWKDEIDILADTTADLATQLERLETDVDRHSRKLLEQHQALLTERDFATSLLSQAQAIILTQNGAGFITRINRFGSALLGYSEDQLVGTPFVDLVMGAEDQQQALDCVCRLTTGKDSVCQQETLMRCNGPEPRCVSWFHSVLQQQGDSDPLLLSVGLDVTARKQAEEKLAWLANHDDLTGLFNRRRFQEEIGQALRQASRYGHPGAVLYLDLDQFKYINDTAGHHAGDHLLKLVADKIVKTLRNSDTTARLGGDEFAVILHETEPAAAEQTAKKLSAALGEIDFRFQNHRHRVSASIGIVLFPLHGTAVYDLMANADLAMYQAKAAGRGRIHLFSEDEQARDRMREHVAWKNRIEQALAERRLVFHFQPILNIREGKVSHYEALLRMVGQNGELHPPGMFIKVAEQTGLIREIDLYVIEMGIATLAKWSQAGHDRTLALNLSGTMMDAAELGPVLRKQLKAQAVDPRRLILEVTETAAVLDVQAARRMMLDIRGLGCRFALDDFGVGLSSFSYLQQLPVDFIKIDGSFIRDLPHRHDNQLFVQALVQVAEGLSRETVAEFVEDGETLQLLQTLGVGYAQGYHVGRPAPEPQATGRTE